MIEFIATLFFFIWFSNMLGYIPLPTNTHEKVSVFGAEIPAFVTPEFVRDEIARGRAIIPAVWDVEAAKIVPELVHADVPVLGFTVQSPSLEDVFVSLTGEGFDVSG